MKHRSRDQSDNRISRPIRETWYGDQKNEHSTSTAKVYSYLKCSIVSNTEVDAWDRKTRHLLAFLVFSEHQTTARAVVWLLTG